MFKSPYLLKQQKYTHLTKLGAPVHTTRIRHGLFCFVLSCFVLFYFILSYFLSTEKNQNSKLSLNLT